MKILLERGVEIIFLRGFCSKLPNSIAALRVLAAWRAAFAIPKILTDTFKFVTEL